MDDNADAKRILLASPLVDWRRQPKQWIWLRTTLCGGWCRSMALRKS